MQAIPHESEKDVTLNTILPSGPRPGTEVLLKIGVQQRAGVQLPAKPHNKEQ